MMWYIKNEKGEFVAVLDSVPEPPQDPVDHPRHYTRGLVEAIDIIEGAVADPVSYVEGCVLKYLLRWRWKDGLSDLKKARWYLDRMIGKLEKEDRSG